jgi:DNA-binding transcriptional MerR regulator
MVTNRSGLSIGLVAREAGCSVASIRYYEDIGLLPSAGRRAGGHRVYGSDDVRRLVFIRRCRDFGFPIQKVRELLAASSAETPCKEARDIAAVQLRTVRNKLVELQALERALAGFVLNCDANCASGTVQDCTLFDDISAQPILACCGNAGKRAAR